MKIASPFLLFILFLTKISAQTVSQPATAFVNSGLYQIAKIEKTKSNTIVDLKISFIPGWWTSFDNDVFIEDAGSMEKYMLDSIQGIALGTKIITPASGDTTVRLFFPAVAKHTKSINFGSAQATNLYGVSLSTSKTKKKTKDVPDAIEKWMQQEIAASKTQTVRGLAAASFYDRDSASIVGYIKGYDPRSGFSSGIIYHQNMMTNESLPATIQIFPDGRFTVSLEIFHPTVNRLAINEKWFPFYIEPGHSIGIVLDWEDFLQLDRFRDRSYTPQFTRYMGPLRKINEELHDFIVTIPDYRSLENLQKTIDPIAFKKKALAEWDQELARFNMYLEKQPISALAKHVLTNDINLQYADYLFDYSSGRDYYSQQDPSNTILKMPIDISYYDFVNRINLNDHALFVNSEFSIFLNRMEFSPLYPRIEYDRKLGESLNAREFRKVYKADELPLAYYFMPLRHLSNQYKHLSIPDTVLKQQKDTLLRTAPLPLFALEMERLQVQRERKKAGYNLPDTPAAHIFKKLIGAHAGKVLVIDFWAQWCGPCRSGIERSVSFRQKWKDHPHLDFLFITDESGTPDMDFFKQYNETNFMKNSYRVTADEYLALRELFKFNGIPRYILVDAEGKIRDDDFETHNTVDRLKMNFPEKFADLTY